MPKHLALLLAILAACGGSLETAADDDAPTVRPDLTVDAGDDVTLALPARSLTLHGSASAQDGQPPALEWSLVSGTDATLAGERTADLGVRGLVPGVYTFRLTASDAAGHVAADEVQVTVTSSGTTFHVEADGSDGTGDGSEAAPWATLARACASVSGPGDVIHVGAGTFRERERCVLAPQVSLEGEGDETHVIPFDTGAGNPYAAGIQLSSASGGTLGSQSISHLWLDGDDVVHNGILVRGRSQVLVRHVTFTRILGYAVAFIPVGSWAAAPAIYEQDNELSSSTATDCSDRAFAGGLITMGGQEGTVIRDNTFSNVGRPQGHNGNVMGAVYGHNKGWSYYRNVSTKPAYDGPHDGVGGGWNFALEVWTNEGGTEIWGNTFIGGGNAIDCGGLANLKGDYAYSWYIHDNVFMLESQLASRPTDSLAPMSVQFESPVTDAIVSNNRFVRVARGVQIILTHGNDTITERIAIHGNVFEDMGYADASLGSDMVNIAITTGERISGIDIDNNTMVGNGHARSALHLTSSNPAGTLSNINLRNNIVQGTAVWGYLVFDGSSAISQVTVARNILHQNANENMPFTHTTSSLSPSVPTVSGLEETGNLVVDPELGADLHPLPGSPAVGAGIDLGHGTTIGAYQD